MYVRIDTYSTVPTARRHFNVSLCFITHDPCNGAETKILLSEAHIINIFPKTTGNKAIKYLLDNYLGMD